MSFIIVVGLTDENIEKKQLILEVETKGQVKAIGSSLNKSKNAVKAMLSKEVIL